MDRRKFIFFLALAGTLPGQVFASELEDFLVRELKIQGFSNITVSRTWLGRVRIVATSDRFKREIIANPRTGEILRDYWSKIANGSGSVDILDPNDDLGTSGSDGDSSGFGSDDGDSGDHGKDDEDGKESHDDEDDKKDDKKDGGHGD